MCGKGASALLIEGARRVGKSYLVKRFIKDEYKTSIYIDFSNVEKDILDLFENDMANLDMFFLKLQSYYAVELENRKSCIVFDDERVIIGTS